MDKVVLEGFWPKDWKEQCWANMHEGIMGHSMPKEIWRTVDDARIAFGHDFVKVRITIEQVDIG
jgi:hypothetical protein